MDSENFNGVKVTEKYLDGLNLEEEFKEFGGHDISEFMEFLEDKYGNSLAADLRFCGFVFNWMSTEEFLDYLRKRYPGFSCVEYTKYWIEI